MQERDSARTTIGELAKQLAATTAAAKTEVAKAYQHNSAARGEIKARKQECKESTFIIAGRRQAIAIQSAVTADTAAEM